MKMYHVSVPFIDMMKTGNNIINLMLDNGLTAREVAEFMGYGEPRAVHRWQRGEALPSVDQLCILSRLLGVPIDDIVVTRDDDGGRPKKCRMAKSMHGLPILLIT